MKFRDHVRHSIPFALLLFNGYLSLSIYSRSGFSHQFLVTAGGTAIGVIGLFGLNLYADSKMKKPDAQPDLTGSWPPAVEGGQQPEPDAKKSPPRRIGTPIVLVLSLIVVCAASAAITVWVMGHPELFHLRP